MCVSHLQEMCFTHYVYIIAFLMCSSTSCSRPRACSGYELAHAFRLGCELARTFGLGCEHAHVFGFHARMFMHTHSRMSTGNFLDWQKFDPA